MKKVPAPKFTDPPIEPLCQDDVEAILKTCTYCRESQTNNRYTKMVVRPIPHLIPEKFRLSQTTATGNLPIFYRWLSKGLPPFREKQEAFDFTNVTMLIDLFRYDLTSHCRPPTVL